MYSKCLEYVQCTYLVDENMITIYSKVLLYAHNVDIMIIIHMHTLVLLRKMSINILCQTNTI